MSQVAWRAPLVLLVAAGVAALALFWPLLTLERSQFTGAVTGSLEPPPSWLLPLDDAYIFIRYAQQLARGRPFEWNDGEPATGASCWVYPWLLLPGQWLFSDLAGWSRFSTGIGFLSLWFLGLAGWRLARTVGLRDPWPVVTGLALIWSGPIAFVSLAGMDSALGCAAVLWAAALWSETMGSPSPNRRGFLACGWIAGLPLLRPDFAILVVVAALAIAVRRGPTVPRWVGLILLLPGLLSGVLNFVLTGTLAPAGVIAKSAMSSPFMTLSHRLTVLGNLAKDNLVPAYAGFHPEVLPPPIGLLAVATALGVGILGWTSWRRSTPIPRQLQALLVLTVVWVLLVAVAPFSGYLSWQFMRHHHPGLACAWTLAILGLALGGRWLIARLPPTAGTLRTLVETPAWRAGWVVLLLLFLGWSWPERVFEFFRAATELQQSHGTIARWLTEQPRKEVLLVHDAGLLALAHDGPAIDIMGLGTAEFARPYRHGLGAVVETLARRHPLPSLAAVRFALFPLRPLLGPPLVISALGEDAVALYPLQRELLRRTALPQPGIDFGYLRDEDRAKLRWIVPPWPRESSFAFTLRGASGALETHGCRPLQQLLGIPLPTLQTRTRIRFAPQPGFSGRIAVWHGNAQGPIGSPAIEVAVDPHPKAWRDLQVPALAPGFGEDRDLLWIKNTGPGAPCIESIAWVS